jgi:hypothetical protein
MTTISTKKLLILNKLGRLEMKSNPETRSEICDNDTDNNNDENNEYKEEQKL